MKTLTTDIATSSLRARFYCIDETGELDTATSHTLLQLIAEAAPPSDFNLEALVFAAEANRYRPSDPGLPDWGVNDKNVWLVPPMAGPGHICISNENIEEYSEEDGQPQQFTYEQFRAALKHWREFRQVVEREGKENLVGKRFEAAFPN